MTANRILIAVVCVVGSGAAFFIGDYAGWTRASAGPCSAPTIQQVIIATERPQMGQLERDFWIKAIATAAAKHGLPPEVVTAKIAQESRFKANAVGAAGERGVAQIMPMWVKGFDPFEIEVSLDKGAEILATELKAVEGDIYRGLRRYNGGGPRGEQIDKTKAYANAVLARVYVATAKACSIPTREKV